MEVIGWVFLTTATKPAYVVWFKIELWLQNNSTVCIKWTFSSEHGDICHLSIDNGNESRELGSWKWKNKLQWRIWIVGSYCKYSILHMLYRKSCNTSVQFLVWKAEMHQRIYKRWQEPFVIIFFFLEFVYSTQRSSTQYPFMIHFSQPTETISLAIRTT